ncbi:type IV pilus modification PilV family protein (plasmid) [Streptomyces sp. BI20]|uniref:type IV pilus modification PilV family protein n=1 Tax=Streptomyces sp. BI20 TaxID=3403460 RepID=UPI003C734B9A
MTAPAPRPPGRSPRRRGEEGETLIEALVAVVLIGVAFLTVLGGLGTAVVSSVAQRQTVGADAIARSTAERIIGAPYAACARGYGTPAPPAGYAVTVTVEYWDGVGAFGPACPSTDTGVQKVTLTVRATGPRPVKDTTLELVKRESMPS